MFLVCSGCAELLLITLIGDRPGEKKELCAVPSKRSRRETVAVLKIWLEKYFATAIWRGEETVFGKLEKTSSWFPKS